MNHSDTRLVAICDIRRERRAQATVECPQTFVTGDYNTLLARDDISAVAIATPVTHHYALAKMALQAGKHVLVEKPITESAATAQELCEIAEAGGLTLAVDHTFIFTGAVAKLKDLMDSGELGDLYYIDSVRVNLGIFQHDINVLFDLAPHDLSVVGYLVGQVPEKVQAMGIHHARKGQEDLAYVHLQYSSGLVAHFHLSWLAPVKIRKMLIAGANKMLVWDDLDQSEKVKIYDKGITMTKDPESLKNIKISYRTGDMLAPNIKPDEALSVEIGHFARCCEGKERPLSSGRLGLDVVRILEAAQLSLRQGGTCVKLEGL
jgi:predicted dehydrogenase